MFELEYVKTQVHQLHENLKSLAIDFLSKLDSKDYTLLNSVSIYTPNGIEIVQRIFLGNWLTLHVLTKQNNIYQSSDLSVMELADILSIIEMECKINTLNKISTMDFNEDFIQEIIEMHSEKEGKGVPSKYIVGETIRDVLSNSFDDVSDGEEAYDLLKALNFYNTQGIVEVKKLIN